MPPLRGSVSFYAIARLSKVDCGATWGQSFSYDAYGNLTKAVLPGDSGLNWQPGYDNSNKYQLSGVSYDSDGNLTNDTFHTYTWDAFGSLTSIDSNTQYHDALGRLVQWKDDSGTTYELMYSPAGGKMGMMTGQTLVVGRIPLPGGALASYGSGGLNNYAHADWLGSTRFSSYTDRTEKWDLAHAPYGEVYGLAGGGAEFTFTGQFSDYGNTNTLWDFPMREYHSSQGRWISPDPAGLAAANPVNPQTWNRYAYVGGNPLSYIDPMGLDSETYTYTGGGPGAITDYTEIDVMANADAMSGAAGGGGGKCVNAGCGSSLSVRQDLGDKPQWWKAPNNGTPQTPTKTHCLGQALKQNGISFTLDVVGAIPAFGNLIHAGAATGRIIDGVVAYGGGAYGVATGLRDESPVGAASTGLGLGLTLAGSALGEGAKAIPIAGNALSILTGAYDAYQGYQTYQQCMAGGG